MLALVHENNEFVLDSFWNVKPMELGVHEFRQTVIKFPCITVIHGNLITVCPNSCTPSFTGLTFQNESSTNSVFSCTDATRATAAFNTRCSLSVIILGAPAKTALQ